MTSSDLRILIENEARGRGLSPATLCKHAVGNNRLHRTLVSGGSCTLDIAERLTAYIAANPPAQNVTHTSPSAA